MTALNDLYLNTNDDDQTSNPNLTGFLQQKHHCINRSATESRCELNVVLRSSTPMPPHPKIPTGGLNHAE